MGVIISTDIIIDSLVGQRFQKHKPEQHRCLIDGETVGVLCLSKSSQEVWFQAPGFQGRVKGVEYSW